MGHEVPGSRVSDGLAAVTSGSQGAARPKQVRSRISARLALNPKIFRRRFALVRDFVVFDDLPLIETAEAGFLDGRDMDEHIFSAALRRNKSVAFLRIEPLHRAACHSQSPLPTIQYRLCQGNGQGGH